MRPLRFKAHNLLSISDLDLDLKDRGLLLVTGYSFDENNENGAGKSNIAANGIIWTKYGFTPNDVRSDEVINCHNPDEVAWGSYRFETNGTTYNIFRQRNPIQLSLSIYVDNLKEYVDVSGKTAQQTQDLIDQALGKSRQAFMQTDYYGNSRSMNYARLTATEQREVLESILPMEEFDQYSEYAAGVMSGLTDKKQTLQNSMLTLKGGLSVTEGSLARLKHESASHDGNIQRAILEINTQLANRPDISDLKSEEYLHNRQQEIIATAKPKHDKLVLLRHQINSFVTLKKNALCPTCKQFIKSDKDESDIDSHNRQKVEMVDEFSTIEKEYISLQDEINKIATQILVHRAYNSYNNLIQKKSEIEAQVNPYKQSIEDTLKTILSMQSEIISINQELLTLSEEYDYVTYWYRAFSKDLKLATLASVCPFLDTRTNHHLAQMQNDQLHVAFSTVQTLASGELKENFNVQAWSDTGGKSFKALSNGEQRLISFAIGLALADLAATKTSGHSKLLILDEPFVQLSERNADAIVQYIRNVLGKSKDTILLISNEEHLKSMIHDRVHVIKRNGLSTLDKVADAG